MSLDVSLIVDNKSAQIENVIYIRENGSTTAITREEWDRRNPGIEPTTFQSEATAVYSANITHNLNHMAEAAGIYIEIWHPNEKNITHAKMLIETLEKGLEELKANPEKYKAFNPPNAWGSYEGLVKFVSDYLDACRKYPEAQIYAWA